MQYSLYLYVFKLYILICSHYNNSANRYFIVKLTRIFRNLTVFRGIEFISVFRKRKSNTKLVSNLQTYDTTTWTINLIYVTKLHPVLIVSVITVMRRINMYVESRHCCVKNILCSTEKLRVYRLIAEYLIWILNRKKA